MLEIKASSNSAGTNSLNVTNSGGTSLLVVANDGNVGIGTLSPRNLLEVGVGKLNVTTTGNVGVGTISPRTALDVAGTITATGFTSTSGGSSGRAKCWKTATTEGFCSSVVDATGACTCN
jgi:hypothetical protein